jgi:hypothetical protein
MKMCQPHWDKLRDAIKSRGLYGMVATDGAQAARDLGEGRPDPLMAAHNAIVGNALNRAGLAVVSPNEDGSERCPLCFLIAAAAGCQCGDPACTPEARAAQSARFEAWIELAADDELERVGAGKAQA